MKMKKIRPFLAQYPFTPIRADIDLSFPKTNNADEVDYVFVDRNKIFYSKYNQTEKIYKDILIESLDDTLNQYDESKIHLIFQKDKV